MFPTPRPIYVGAGLAWTDVGLSKPRRTHNNTNNTNNDTNNYNAINTK